MNDEGASGGASGAVLPVPPSLVAAGAAGGPVSVCDVFAI
jgi:hypothetical protein